MDFKDECDKSNDDWVGDFLLLPKVGLPEKGKPLWAATGLSCSELVKRPESWQLLIVSTAYKASRKLPIPLGRARGRAVDTKPLLVSYR